MSQFHKNFIIRVIDLYGLELDGDRVDSPIDTWLQTYDPNWIVKAIVESLYRGRYKIKSIDNILKDWQRLGKPRYNFTPEYERGILRNLPEQTDLLATPTPLNLENAERTHNSPEDDDRQFEFLPGIPSEDEQDLHKRGEIESGSGEMANNFVVNSPVGHSEGWLAAQLYTSEHHTSNQQFPLPVSSLEIEPARRFASSDLHDGVGQIVSQPVKYRLFNILKAIVDPKNQQQVEEVCPSVCLPLHIVNTNSSSNKQFIFPLENTSEEQCL